MRSRTIDVVLIVGLALVAGAIVWTLFSLGRDDAARPATNPGGTVETPANGAGIVPVAPDGSSVGVEGSTPDRDGTANDGGASGVDGNGVAPLVPGDAADSDGASEATTADGGTTTATVDTGPIPDRPDPEIPAESAAAVPASGPAGLGRVGFSFVTGGAGACGIVLEPWTHVAVSRELLDAYGCGAEVTVDLDEPKDGRTTVQAIVADTMNPAFSRTVNIYVGEDEPALQYGLTTGTIAPR